MAGAAEARSPPTGRRPPERARAPTARRRRRSRSVTSTGWPTSRARPGATPAVPTRAYLTGLGDMYVADPRFGANYGGVEGATFVRDALRVYADRNLVTADAPSAAARAPPGPAVAPSWACGCEQDAGSARRSKRRGGRCVVRAAVVEPGATCVHGRVPRERSRRARRSPSRPAHRASRDRSDSSRMPSRTSYGRPARPSLRARAPIASAVAAPREPDREEGEGEAAERADEQAKASVPTPTLPPRSHPMISTVTSIAGSHHPDRPAGAGVEPGHQAVARARARASGRCRGRSRRRAAAGRRRRGAPAPRASVCCGMSASPSCALGPMSSTFSTVPRPGRCRSGIQKAGPRAPTRLVTSPNGMPVLSESPCASTSHGETPMPARTIIAMAIP